MYNRIKIIRKKEGLTQKEFAHRIGIAQTTLSELERGTRELPERYIKAIVNEFDVNYEYITNGTGDVYKVKYFGYEQNVDVKQIANELYNLDDEFKKIVLCVVKTLKDELNELKKPDIE